MKHHNDVIFSKTLHLCVALFVPGADTGFSVQTSCEKWGGGGGGCCPLLARYE